MLLTVIALFFSAIAAGMIQSVTGFGAAVLLMLILPLFFNMAVSAGVSSSICLGLTGIMAWRYRKHIQWKLVLLPAICYLMTSTIAIKYSKGINTSTLSALFGGFLLLLGSYSFFFAQRFSIRANVFSATVCGLVGGICSGLFSTGGPVIALYYLPASEKKENYLANIQFLFLLSNIMNLYTRCTNGLYTADLVPYTLIGFGGVLLGKQCGVHFVDSIDTSLMKKLVYSFIAISGLLLVLKRFL